MPPKVEWRSIPCCLAELSLETTLVCGQSFRWCQTKEKEWTSVLRGRVWTLSQTEDQLLYKVYGGMPNDTAVAEPPASKRRRKDVKPKNPQLDVAAECETILRDYFQLQVNLREKYDEWSLADANFKSVSTTFPGIRILRQDPEENLFSFICSSNNNISRISSMVEKLCTKYGCRIMELDGREYYAFPSVERLAEKQVEQELRQMGFGYRAKYISQSAQFVMKQSKGPLWLHSLRDLPYEEAHAQLVQLPGVGAKVADCVSLMSLDKSGAIPVDTHVWQIACRDYLPHLKKHKTVTDKVYKEIGDHFRKIFGEYAGWAHSVLFSADLKKFKKQAKK